MSDPNTTDLPSRLRAMSAEFDDPMCSNHPIQMLLEEAATEIEIWRARDADNRTIVTALETMKEMHRGI